MYGYALNNLIVYTYKCFFFISFSLSFTCVMHSNRMPYPVYETDNDNKSSQMCSSCLSITSSSISSSCHSISEGSICSHCSVHEKQETHLKKIKTTPAHTTIIEPITITTKSITSTKNQDIINHNRSRCCCFRKNSTSRMIVFLIFFIFVLGAITAFFCWPRTPRISMGGGASSVNNEPPDWWAGERLPLSAQDNTVIPSRPSLRGTWQMNVTLDNRDNWIPTHIRSLEFVLMDSLTLSKFAWASASTMVLQPNTISPISLTFNVNYQAPDNTDPTFQNLYNACGPLKTTNDQRPALKVLLKVNIFFF